MITQEPGPQRRRSRAVAAAVLATCALAAAPASATSFTCIFDRYCADEVCGKLSKFSNTEDVRVEPWPTGTTMTNGHGLEVKRYVLFFVRNRGATANMLGVVGPDETILAGVLGNIPQGLEQGFLLTRKAGQPARLSIHEYGSELWTLLTGACTDDTAEEE